MKSRVGFVSNSSSSSFVMVGVKLCINDHLDELNKMLNVPFSADMDFSDYWNYEGEHLDGLDVRIDDDDIYLGKEVCYSDGFYGGDDIEFAVMESATLSLAVKKLRDNGFKPKIWVCYRSD